MKDENKLQIIFSIAFLLFYFLIIVFLLCILFFGNTLTEIPEWSTILISSIFGAMTAKMGTIVDYLFGGSNDHPKKC